MGRLLTKRRRRVLLRSLLVLMLALFVRYGQDRGWFERAGSAVEQAQPGQYLVTGFADGDTIHVDMNGTRETVRMIGVDTPETHDPRKEVQCYGEAASAFTRSLIGRNRVRLEADPTNTNRDRYQRLLRYVYLPDGRLVNAEIIRQGYGFACIVFPFQKADEFESYEAAARNANLGLWGQCTVQADTGAKATNDAPRP